MNANEPSEPRTPDIAWVLFSAIHIITASGVIWATLQLSTDGALGERIIGEVVLSIYWICMGLALPTAMLLAGVRAKRAKLYVVSVSVVSVIACALWILILSDIKSF
jgi:hypothetical protein